MRARIFGTSAHGSFAASSCQVAEGAMLKSECPLKERGSMSVAALPATSVFTNSRRLFTTLFIVGCSQGPKDQLVAFRRQGRFLRASATLRLCGKVQVP